MRHLPTWSLGLALSLAWLGCAAETSDPVSEESPSESARPPKSDRSSSERPPFEPTFPEPPPEEEGQQPNPGQTTCEDKDDPGGAESVAKALAPTDDCDDTFKTVSGIANGPVDVDFYKLSAEDKFLCALETEFGSQTAGLEFCVYARCKNSTANAVSGCKHGTLTTAPSGIKGCCTATPGKATPDLDCSGITDDDSADFYISVKPTGPAQCLPYSFSYRY